MIKTCGIYLVNDDYKVLICHPTNHPWNFWSIPKGLLDNNETELEAATRELLEETCIDLKSIDHSDPVRMPDVIYLNGKKTLVSFLVKVKNIPIESMRCDSWVGDKFPEVDEFRWVTLDEASELLHESQRNNLKSIK